MTKRTQKSTFCMISRKQAKQLGLTRYFTGIPCKRGHINERFTCSALCLDCVSIHDKKSYERRKTYHRTLVRQNIERHEKESPGFQARRMKQWRKDNKELWLADRLFQENKRRVQTASWANKSKIKDIYKQSVQLSEETGIPHEVHHIVPLLECDDVCGLHCEDNLIILTQAEHDWFHDNSIRIKLLW